MSNRKPARKAMPFHEVTNIFPPMGEEEFKALTEDIRANGLREAIWTHEGKIIDGRNRYSAILRLQEQKHQIEPTFREWDGEGSLVAFVVSLNLHRRHLNESQREMIAAQLANQEKGRPKKNPPNGGISSGENRPNGRISQPEAARLLNVSERNVSRAAKVVRHGDEKLINSVRAGELPVSTAVKAIDAAERYPEIARVVSRPQDRATIAENLDKLPEGEREKKLNEALKGTGGVLAELANKPPMPPKKAESAQDLWRDFFDDADRTLTRLGARGAFSQYIGLWDYEEKQWFLGRLRDLMQTLNGVEVAALGGGSYDEGTAGATGEGAVH